MRAAVEIFVNRLDPLFEHQQRLDHRVAGSPVSRLCAQAYRHCRRPGRSRPGSAQPTDGWPARRCRVRGDAGATAPRCRDRSGNRPGRKCRTRRRRQRGDAAGGFGADQRQPAVRRRSENQGQCGRRQYPRAYSGNVRAGSRRSRPTSASRRLCQTPDGVCCVAYRHTRSGDALAPLTSVARVNFTYCKQASPRVASRRRSR